LILTLNQQWSSGRRKGRGGEGQVRHVLGFLPKRVSMEEGENAIPVLNLTLIDLKSVCVIHGEGEGQREEIMFTVELLSRTVNRYGSAVRSIRGGRPGKKRRKIAAAMAGSTFVFEVLKGWWGEERYQKKKRSASAGPRILPSRSTKWHPITLPKEESARKRKKRPSAIEMAALLGDLWRCP